MRRSEPMPAATRAWLDEALHGARQARDPWPHLERAHVVSQPWAWPHTRVHWIMLTTAVRRRERREAVGQVIRLIVAGPGSLVGKYPVGNTGRTTMGLTEVAEVPADLNQIMSGRSGSASASETADA